MAFANETFWADAVPGRYRVALPRPGQVMSAMAVLGIGTALTVWSVATLETLHRVESSLLTASTVFPESVLGSGAVALANPTRTVMPLPASWDAAFGAKARRHAPASDEADARPAYAVLPPSAQETVQGSPKRSAQGAVKSARLPASAAPAKTVKLANMRPMEERFGPATSNFAPKSTSSADRSLALRARLAAMGAGKSPALASVAPSPAKFVTAFASVLAGRSDAGHARPAAAPLGERFGAPGSASVRAVAGSPAAERFGPAVIDVNRSSELALALADALPPGLFGAASAPVPSPAPVQVASLEPQQSPRDILGEASPLAAAIPEDVPLPSRRPVSTARPAAKPEEKPEPAARTRPAEQPRRHEETAAAPAASEEAPSIRTRGGEVDNRFSVPSPTPPSGVAVYDIKAATVYMPNGDKLEAHSGLGHMVDKPRYADRKNRGPTPPNTYKLVMRESRFHGVEAIRLIPVDGNNKYGRNGLLAHTYMLRGGLAQSNGCVVFKNYGKFLRAFKRGRITRLVVVPSRSALSSTTLASAARGA